jgi:hypothetical protein
MLCKQGVISSNLIGSTIKNSVRDNKEMDPAKSGVFFCDPKGRFAVYLQFSALIDPRWSWGRK